LHEKARICFKDAILFYQIVTYTYIYMYKYMYKYMYIYVYIYMCVCVRIEDNLLYADYQLC